MGMYSSGIVVVMVVWCGVWFVWSSVLPYGLLRVVVFPEGYCCYLVPYQVWYCGVSMSVYVCECVLDVVSFSGPLSYAWCVVCFEEWG